MDMAPETRYARSGNVHIAYQVVGEGSLDLVYVPGGTHHLEMVWENPPHARFFERLKSIGRVLLFTSEAANALSSAKPRQRPTWPGSSRSSVSATASA
jgi:putative intracellular protease/amidase